MAVAIAPWGDEDRQRLLSARSAKGHSQTKCAEELRVLGCGGADQTSVSRWETNVHQPRWETVAAIRRYASDAGIQLAPQDNPDLMPAESSAAEPFDSFVRGITNEPFLGPRQAALVDAQTDRLRTGPPMSDADDAARIAIMRLLGLE